MDPESLRRIAMFSNSDPETLRRCVADHRIFSRKYAKGATVHRQRDPCSTLDVVLSGNLAAYSLSENGSAVSMFEFHEQGVIGANLLFGESNAYPLNIYAVTACELLHIQKSAVSELLHGHDFVIHFIRSLSENTLGMNRRIAMLAYKTLRENILDYLRQQSVLQGSSDILLPISKKELADHLGVQRPSLFRELKKMKDEGLLDVSNRRVRMRTNGAAKTHPGRNH